MESAGEEDTQKMLAFTPIESPPWRSCTSLSTSDMISEIQAFIRAGAAATVVAEGDLISIQPKDSDDDGVGAGVEASMGFRQAMMAHFVFSVANIEGEGLRSLSETEYFCTLISRPGASIEDIIQIHGFDEAETRSTFAMYKATCLLTNYCSSIPRGSPPVLDTSFVRSFHEVLFSDSADEWNHAGQFRKCSAFTRQSFGQINSYLNYRKIPHALNALICITNRLLVHIFSRLTSSSSSSSSSGQPADQRFIESLLKLGGAFFLKFEQIHPFHDGNGRVGRLLLACILSSIAPLGCPTSLYQLCPSPARFPVFVDRSAYLHCFEADDDIGDPSAVTALIIEAMFVAWQQLHAIVYL